MRRYTIKELREWRGWRQADLAGKLGVSKLTIHKWESGKAIPYPRNRKKLADLFHINVEQVIFQAERDG